MKPSPRPSSLSPLFADMVETAKFYLGVGPELYRTFDETGMPDESLSKAEMAVLKKGVASLASSPTSRMAAASKVSPGSR